MDTCRNIATLCRRMTVVSLLLLSGFTPSLWAYDDTFEPMPPGIQQSPETPESARTPAIAGIGKAEIELTTPFRADAKLQRLLQDIWHHVCKLQ